MEREIVMFGIGKKKTISNITYASISGIGDQKINEDCLGVYEEEGKFHFVLCDGLGGHGNGDIASAHVTEAVIQSLATGASMEESIQYAQGSLLEKQKEYKAENSMKTTLTCLQIQGGKARYGHVGDSRIYHFVNGKIKGRTLDHSVPQMLANRGEIRDAEIRFHEDRSKLIRVMGVPWNEAKYQITDEISLVAGTTFLMATDGFWELIDEKMMSKILKRAGNAEEWLAEMEGIVKKNGEDTNMDNYSAIAVFMR